MIEGLFPVFASWQITTLSELCSGGDASIQTGPFGSALHASDYVVGGIPCVMPQDIRHGKIVTSNIARITPEDHERLKGFQLRPGDIVYPRRGDITKRALVGEREQGWLCGTGCLRIRPNTQKVDPHYLSYYLAHSDVCDWIDANAVGATMPHLNTGLAGNIPVVVPPISTQLKIASILGALDDKIELNRRMSATLEDMARSMYRSWFVDFDPMHAKMEGRQPAFMDEAAAALFPDRFGDDGLPEGWKLGKLSDLIDFNPTERLSKGIEAPYLDMKTLPTSGMQHETAIQRSFTSGTKFRNGDTLLARITPCLENGKTALVQGLEGDAIGWGSTEFIVMRPASNTALAYPYCVARSSDFRDEAIASMTGSSGRQRADAGRIKSIDAAIPSLEIMTEFSSITDPLIRKIAVLGSESQTLAALRDSLLPKLMSGELRVGEAREQVEEVA